MVSLLCDGRAENWRQRVENVSAAVLMLIALLLPFSIAASNILFALLLLLSLITGAWLRGCALLWGEARSLIVVWCVYMLLMVMGIAWSSDMGRGLVILSKQWSWLLLPALVVICYELSIRRRIMLFLSVGLGLHLLLAIAQSQGVPLPVAAPGGSSAQDATGLIGHIGFGFIYGIWAAWLIHEGSLATGKLRYGLWGLASVAIVLIFAAQGRSGYLVAAALLLMMFWKLCVDRLRKRTVAMIAIAVVMMLTVVALGPAKNRIVWTVDSLGAFSQGDLSHTEARISLWYMAWEGWRMHPFAGVGTGGFPKIADEVIAMHPEILSPSLVGATYIAHPHQMYLMDLVRWGPVGLLLLLLFLGLWIRMGWRLDWQQHDGLLMALSGAALAVHGFSAPSLEEYYSSIYAVLFMAVGMSAVITQRDDVKPHVSGVS